MEQILETFSDILNCHIDFTNTTGDSIASSSYIRRRAEDNPRPVPFGGLVTQRVVEDSSTFVLDRRFTTRTEPCNSCSHSHNCEIKLEVVSPIVVDEETRGVLAFAAYNRLEADWLASQLDVFRTINNSLARVIASFLSAAGDICEPILQDRVFDELWHARSDSVPKPGACPLLKESLTDPFEKILGLSPEVIRAKEHAAQIAKSDENTLIVGETGTGKELFAKAIHACSGRSTGPFIAVNCAAIPDSLLESELFGYCPGAFTGANTHGQKGRVEAASGGTLFLDEIGEMSLHLQAKILRLIEEKTVHRIGEAAERQVNVRIIAATNQQFPELLEGNALRADLFYRLAVHYLELPALRDRKDDVRFLANVFLQENGCSPEAISPLVGNVISVYDWPGNVRELKNCILHSTNLAAGRKIKVEHLPPWIVNRAENRSRAGQVCDVSGNSDRLSVLDNAEAEQIRQALDRFGWSGSGKRDAARHLDISLSTLYRKMRLYSIKRE